MSHRSRHRSYGRTIGLALAAAGALLSPPAETLADTVHASDGRVWKGILLAENENEVRLDLGFDVARLKREEVLSIERADAEENGRLLRDLNARRARRDRLLAGRVPAQHEVPLINLQGHVIVEALLEDRVRAQLLIDTGSTVTFLSPEIAEKLGVRPSPGAAKVEVITSDGSTYRIPLIVLRSLRLGAAEARDVPVAVMPRKRGEPSPFGDGLLGVSFLSRYNFKIDYKRNRLILES